LPAGATANTLRRPAADGVHGKRARFSAILVPAALLVLSALAVYAIARGSSRFPYGLNATPPRAIVLIVVDALRADRLSAYGFHASQPNIKELADSSSVFDDAYTNASWTKPAISSLFTGLWPTELGTTSMLEEVRGKLLETRLPESVPTLAALMRRNAYATAGFVNNPHLSPALGFAAGFDVYEHGTLACEEIAGKFAGWLRGLPDERNSFAYLHLLEPHAPYEVPATSSSQKLTKLARLNRAVTEATDYGSFTRWRDDVNEGRLRLADADLAAILELYDTEILRVDQAVGAVVGSLKQCGVFSEALIVLMADHGENFLEHGIMAHPATTLYEPQMRIPLLIKFPESWGIHPGRVKGRVQTIDITATLAAACGGALGRGRSLAASAAFGRAPDGAIVCEAVRGAALYEGSMKIVFRFKDDRAVVQEIYNLSRDADTRVNLAAKKPSYSARARGRMERWLAFVDARGRANPSTGSPLDQERQERLKALGYLN
jgi:arylsulfatase A-like enzyme